MAPKGHFWGGQSRFHRGITDDSDSRFTAKLTYSKGGRNFGGGRLLSHSPQSSLYASLNPSKGRLWVGGRDFEGATQSPPLALGWLILQCKTLRTEHLVSITNILELAARAVLLSRVPRDTRRLHIRVPHLLPFAMRDECNLFYIMSIRAQVEHSYNRGRFCLRSGQTIVGPKLKAAWFGPDAAAGQGY